MKSNKLDNSNINIIKEREMMTKNGKVKLKKRLTESRLRIRTLILQEVKENLNLKP